MRTMQVVDVMSDQMFSLARNRSKGIKWPNTLSIIYKYRFSLMIFKLSDAVLNLSNVHTDSFSFVKLETYNFKHDCVKTERL